MTSFAFIIREPDFVAPSNQGRYEYRIWPRRTPSIVTALQQGWALDGAEARADIYLLGSNSSNALVKLREGCRLEIKRRGQDFVGLQHWRVALSDDFPVSPSALKHLSAALLIPNLPMQTACLSPAHLLVALSRLRADLETLTVRKSRLSFRDKSCRAEVTRVVWANQTRLTIALEDPDPAHAAGAVKALGLDRWMNRSYGEVLRARPLLIATSIQARNA